MRERPILFSAPMVRAILDGSKTQTRRLVRDAIGAFWDHGGWKPTVYDVHILWREVDGPYQHVMNRRCPYGNVGDRLWVRESFVVGDHDFVQPYPAGWLLEEPGAETNERSWWAVPPEDQREQLAKKFGTAGTHGGTDIRVRPAIHMPRWASRITLEITSVHVERLQDISEEDACSEGVERSPADQTLVFRDYSRRNAWFQDWTEHSPDYVPEDQIARASFRTLWDSINAKRAPWELNPWVWVIEFKRIERLGCEVTA